MHTFQLVLAFIIVTVLPGLLNLSLNYISRRDGGQILPLQKKLWLIPLLSILIVVPVGLFSMGFAFAFAFQRVMTSPSFMSPEFIVGLLTLSLTVLAGFLLCESIVHPVCIALLRLWLRRDVPVYIKQAVTLIADTLVLYALPLILPGLPFRGLLQSLSISLFYHFMEWMLIGIQTWVQRRKRSGPEMEPARTKGVS
ncbi:hypothetical protein [Paenibacillus sp. DMB20]|uniref:hypothetical protein n=1 Tax=Paenibacillus sp. DMB20 TaxID=1642570 RepID=UPI0006276415|nr:hypothetical protein [Paenibacillus sp. DMB20]KKO54708.1 hypothetical protein XI25_05285 [Paenibacillus sp. DMB20]